MYNQIFPLEKYPTLHAFAMSDAKVKVVTGPAGTAKTSFMAMEILRRACMQEPNHEGIRYTKVMVGRNTYQILKSSTIDSFKRMWGNLAWFKTGAAPLRAGLYL